MEALICRKLGDPTSPISESSAIILSKSHPIPVITTPTGVRVRIRASSLNYANYLQILGKYQEKPPLPFIPGSDYSGTVDAVGVSVTKFKVGDRVCSLAAIGSFAEFIVTDEKDLSVVLLVLGEAGGVGLSALQIGKVCGATVIAVARGAEKRQFLRSMGVDHVVDPSEGGIIENVKEFLKLKKLKGVDVLYDPVGGKLTKEAMKLLNWGAQILVIGFASGEIPIIPANIALVKNWTIHGLYWGSYKIHCPEVLENSLNELFSWLARVLISVNIYHTYNLSEANLAFASLQQRKAIGKVMIIMENRGGSRSKL